MLLCDKDGVCSVVNWRGVDDIICSAVTEAVVVAAISSLMVVVAMVSNVEYLHH